MCSFVSLALLFICTLCHDVWRNSHLCVSHLSWTNKQVSKFLKHWDFLHSVIQDATPKEGSILGGGALLMAKATTKDKRREKRWRELRGGIINAFHVNPLLDPSISHLIDLSPSLHHLPPSSLEQGVHLQLSNCCTPVSVFTTKKKRDCSCTPHPQSKHLSCVYLWDPSWF